MKNNYQPGNKITITKPGKFQCIEGEIISHNTETVFKPLYVDLKEFGRWSFNYEDLSLTGKENSLKQGDNDVKVEKLKNIKAKVVLTKRKYNKKVK